MPYTTTDIKYDEGHQFKDCCNLLLVIENKHTEELLKVMKPIEGHHYIYRAYNYATTYYIGTFGSYCAILAVHSNKRQAAKKVANAISDWSPTTIIMLGDAFGINKKKQNIGDVLVADQLIPYDAQSINDDGTIYQSEHPLSGTILQDRLNSVDNWSFFIGKELKAKVHVGPLLTGSVNIQSKNFKKNLLDHFPKAVGGDANAQGVYEAVMSNYSNRNIEWIIVKGLSHFGDGDTKSPKKAIKSAIDFTRIKFCNKMAFSDLSLILSGKCDVEIPVSAPPPPRVLSFNKKKIVGYKDENNKEVIPHKYIDGKEFKEGLASVKLRVSEEERIRFIEEQVDRGSSLKEISEKLKNLGRWGCINTEGETVIEHVYDKAFRFKGEKARVYKDGIGFYINKKGEIVI